MSEAQFNALRETSWRRPLTAEEADSLHHWLAAHPEFKETLDGEMGLTNALQALPDVPVASNFTARVMAELAAEIAREDRARQRGVLAGWSWRSLVPRFAVVGAVLFLSATGFLQYKSSTRAEMARDLALVSAIMATSGPEALANFDAIQTMPAGTDDDLLAALE